MAYLSLHVTTSFMEQGSGCTTRGPGHTDKMRINRSPSFRLLRAAYRRQHGCCAVPNCRSRRVCHNSIFTFRSGLLFRWSSTSRAPFITSCCVSVGNEAAKCAPPPPSLGVRAIHCCGEWWRAKCHTPLRGHER